MQKDLCRSEEKAKDEFRTQGSQAEQVEIEDKNFATAELTQNVCERRNAVR